jgi:hypothetical protein
MTNIQSFSVPRDVVENVMRDDLAMAALTVVATTAMVSAAIRSGLII